MWRAAGRRHQLILAAQLVGRMSGSRALSAAAARPVSHSRRIDATDDPVIVRMAALLRTAPPGTVSLAQGIVWWPPPDEALAAARDAVDATPTGRYGPDAGLHELRDALRDSLERDHGLSGVEVMVTQGANQAYVNAVLATLDAGDAAVIFAPYYFNHKMALQMCGHAEQTLIGPPAGHDLLPDLDWLESTLAERNALGAGPGAVRLVTLVTPNNPTGVCLPPELVRRAHELCTAHGAWLFLDHAYAHFLHDGAPLATRSAENILSGFSFSKAYGMAGWRVGALAYPASLGPQLNKAQDTVVICPTIISQRAALGALQAGARWVRARVHGLRANREAIRAALAPLGEDAIVGGAGAIYFLARLPPGHEDDSRVVEWMLHRHRVAIIPASYCGAPGHVRVCYSNLPPEQCVDAARRLADAVRELLAAPAEKLYPSRE